MHKQFISHILRHQKIAVFSHLRPDGDCLGSQIALCIWLQKNGIEAAAFNEDPIPANLQWMLSYYEIKNPLKANLKDFDAFMVVDGNALHRFGNRAAKIPDLQKPVYMIDHHPNPEDIFEMAISETEASSTAELVYGLFAEHNPEQIDEGVAKSLFAGIMTDTGSFQFSSVQPKTMRVAADLMERGNFTPDEIVHNIYAGKPLKQLKLLSMALDTITLHQHGQLATIHITDEMMRNTQTSKYDTEGFVQYPLTIEGVKACVMLREDADSIKLSLRSKSDVDVNKWARRFDGGGHKKAAGASHPGPIQKAIDDVIAVGAEQLNSGTI